MVFALPVFYTGGQWITSPRCLRREMISRKTIKNQCTCVNRICEDFELHSCTNKYIAFKNSPWVYQFRWTKVQLKEYPRESWTVWKQTMKAVWAIFYSKTVRVLLRHSTLDYEDNVMRHDGSTFSDPALPFKRLQPTYSKVPVCIDCCK